MADAKHEHRERVLNALRNWTSRTVPAARRRRQRQELEPEQAQEGYRMEATSPADPASAPSGNIGGSAIHGAQPCDAAARGQQVEEPIAADER